METKRKVTEAFKALRKEGYFARQNFQCCQSCGWYAIPEGREEKAVFYHKQDAERFRETGECAIAWSGDGARICEVFRSHGLKVEWDGSASRRIFIS